MKKSLFLLSLVLIVNTAPHQSYAGEDYRAETTKTIIESDYPYEAGVMEVQLLGGAFGSFAHEPTLNYAVGTARLGWMLCDPIGSACLRGNFEILIEGFGAGIFEGPGSVIAGAAVLFRYNFVQEGARLVPYIQVGGGGAYSDVADDESQRLIGSDFSFNVVAAIGVRYMFSDRCALAIEGGYQHISNANTSDRNLGLNAAGGQIGFSCFF
jgi:Lipid A 3-O-deacylase (PagL)